ncbi:MAG: O-antigen ligase family protein, partial [Candidatus Levyibacteriota bacterium]
AIDVGIFALVSLWLLISIIKKRKVTVPLQKEIFLFAIIGAFSLFLNISSFSTSQLFISFLYLFRWIYYAGVYFLMVSFDKKSKQSVIISLFISGFLVTLFGFLQYIYYPSLRNLYYAGWDEHLYRIFSTFLDPNFAGAFFMLFFILLFSYLLSAYKDKKRKEIYFFGISAVIVLFALFLTYSRGAYLSVTIALVVLLLKRGYAKWIVRILGVVILFAVISFFFFRRVSEGTNLLRQVSTVERFHNAQNAFFIFSKNPLFGVGFDTYRYAQRNTGILKDGAWEAGHGSAGADSSLLFVLATTGIIGFTLYLRLLQKMFLLSSHQDVISSAFLASLAGLLVDSFFINALFYPSIMVWMWTLLGIMENT